MDTDRKPILQSGLLCAYIWLRLFMLYRALNKRHRKVDSPVETSFLEADPVEDSTDKVLHLAHLCSSTSVF